MATVDVLRHVPLFSGMTDRSIESIATLAAPAAYDVGDTLIQQGDPGESFIVLTTGAADVTRDGQTIRALQAGDFIGEISLIDGGPRTATVTATAPVEALVIDRSGFDRLMSDYPVVRYDLVTAMAQRLRERAPLPTD